MENNDSGHTRGIHLIILNLNDLNVEFAKVFDTYKTSETFEKFIDSFEPAKMV